VIPDAGLRAYRELDNAFGLTVSAGEIVADERTAGAAAMPWSICCGG
jgi:hypothetical protein